MFRPAMLRPRPYNFFIEFNNKSVIMGSDPSKSQQLQELYDVEQYDLIGEHSQFRDLSMIIDKNNKKIYALVVRPVAEEDKNYKITHPHLIKCIESKIKGEHYYERWEWSQISLDTILKHSNFLLKEIQSNLKLILITLLSVYASYSMKNLLNIKIRPSHILIFPQDYAEQKFVVKIVCSQLWSNYKEQISNPNISSDQIIDKVKTLAQIFIQLCSKIYNQGNNIKKQITNLQISQRFGSNMLQILSIMQKDEISWVDAFERCNNLLQGQALRQYPHIYVNRNIHQRVNPVITYRPIYYNYPPFVRDYSPIMNELISRNVSMIPHLDTRFENISTHFKYVTHNQSQMNDQSTTTRKQRPLSNYKQELTTNFTNCDTSDQKLKIQKGKKIEFIPSLKSMPNANHFSVPVPQYICKTTPNIGQASKQTKKYNESMKSWQKQRIGQNKRQNERIEQKSQFKSVLDLLFANAIEISSESNPSNAKQQSLNSVVDWKINFKNDQPFNFELTPDKNQIQKQQQSKLPTKESKPQSIHSSSLVISQQSSEFNAQIQNLSLWQSCDFEGTINHKGVRQGQGRLYFKTGGSYSGQLAKGVPHGYGKLFYGSGRLAYDGYWKYGQFHHYGKIYSEKQSYIDQFSYNNFDYLEQIQTQNIKNPILRYEGLEICWKFYEGELLKGQKFGKGVLMLQNGERLQGEFKNNKVHGHCAFIGKSGVVKGIWHQNVLVRQLNRLHCFQQI